MTAKITAQLEQVHDEKSFLAFARALMSSGLSQSGEVQESLGTFLESAIAWAEDSDFGSTQGLSADNPWKKFAVFLYCGKIYE